MNLNNLFSQSKLDQYAAYLKSTSLSDASLKRKLSSLSSFQKFLVKNNLIKVQSIQNPPAFENGGFSKKRFSLNFIKERIKLPPFLYRYLIIFSLFVIGLGLGFTLYRQAFAQSTKNFAYTTASNPTIANRQLSFQGRLTDSSGNPITSSTNIVFKLYDTETVSTGTSLYTSATGNSQTVVPDENGIFSVVIGKTHGTEIPDSVFTENSAVYLEITAGNEVMSPRQPIATVAYALNSESLQGLPPSASGLKNTVLVVDELGNINLGETSPTIKSTSGTMGIEAQAVLIKATDGSGGNITINPDANGEIKLVTEGTGVSDGFINATNANLASGNLFNASINNDNRGYKFINFSNYDISTTQLTSRFSVDAYGNTNVGGTLSTTNLAVGSSDLVNNLNSDLLDGQHSNYFVNIGQTGSLPYDNYNHWDLQTNGVGNTAILSGNAVNFINGVGISISQTGSVITIDNTSIGTAYTAGVGLTLSSTNVFSLDLASANTWTALQNFSAGATISNLSIGGTFLSVGSTNTVTNLSANYLNGKADTYFLSVGSTDNFITTLTAGTDISITGSGIGRTINDTSTLDTVLGRGASTTKQITIGYSGAPFVLSSGNTSTVTNLSADYLDGYNSAYFVNIGQTGNFITTISVGASGLSVSGSGIGRTLTNTGLVDITNSTLTRSGSAGTYTVGLNLGSTNTWTALQNLSAGATISNLSIGGTFLSVGSTNLVTNLNADLLDGYNASAFEVPLTFTNGLTRTSNDIHLGGELTEATRFNIGSTEAFFIQFTTGNVGIGTTAPTESLEVIGNVKAQKFYDQDNPLYFIDPTNASSTNASLSLTTSGSIRFNSDVGGTHIVTSSASRIQNYPNGLLLGVSTSTSGNIVGWDNNLFLNVSGNVGIGTTNPTAILDISSIYSTMSLPNISGTTNTALTRIGYADHTWAGVELDMGIYNGGGYPAWIQARNPADYSINRNLLLNPNGGNVGIGTTAPTESLEVIGNVKAQKFYDQDNPLYFIDPANASSTNASLSLTTSGSIRFNSDVGGTHIVTSSASRIQNYPNGLLLGVSTSTSGNIVGWDNNLFLTTSGNVGIGTTYSTSKLTLSNTNSVDLAFNLTDIHNTVPTSRILADYNTVSWSDNNLKFQFWNGSVFQDNVTFTSSGNVGIGTTNPTTALDVVGVIRSVGGLVSVNPGNTLASTSLTYWDDGTTVWPRIRYGGSGAGSGSGFLIQGMGDSVKLAILNSGSIGIGTTNPLSKLEVKLVGSGESTSVYPTGNWGAAVFNSENTSTYGGMVVGSRYANNNNIVFQAGNLYNSWNPYFTIKGGGFIGIGTENPSYAKLQVNATSLGTNALISLSTVDGTYNPRAIISHITATNNQYVKFDSGYSSGTGYADWVFMNGNVGIGTTAPNGYLHVYNSNSSLDTLRLQFNAAGGGNWGINPFISGISNGGLSFVDRLNGTTPFVIAATTGNVGIGTTAPAGKLTVTGTSGYYNGTGSDGIAQFTTGTGVAATEKIQFGVVDAKFGWIQAVKPGTAVRNLALNPGGGNVGIGTTNPTASLDVDGSIRATGYQAPSSGAGVEIHYVAGGSRIFAYNRSTSVFETFYLGNGALYVNASGTITMPNGHSDLAENYLLEGTALRGSLISIGTTNPSTAVVSNKNHKAILGAVTTSPGAVMDFDDGFQIGLETKKSYTNEKTPIALTGIVPILVSSSNGQIFLGDAITYSDLPGFGAKVITASQTVGKAFEAFTPTDSTCIAVSSLDSISWPDDDGKNPAKPCYKLPNGTYVGKIMAFITASWYDPDINLTATGDVNINYNISDSVLASLGYDGAKNEIESATYKLTDSTGAVVTRISQFSEIASAKIKAGLISATNIIADNIIVKNLRSDKMTSNELLSPKANIRDLTTENLTSTDATISGTLTTKELRSEKLTSDQLNSREATISTLYADNIISKEGSFGDLMAQKVGAVRDELKKLITDNEASSSAITGTSIASLTSDWSMNIASDSAKIEGDLSISNNLVIGAKLLVNGDTQLANAFITGTFSAGEVSIKDNFIQTTNTALYIQPSNTGSIHMMGDTLVIADNGEVQINGNLAVSGSLFANLITASEIQTQKLTATEINSNQVKIATDSAQVIIADPGFAALATSSANLTSNATAGIASLPAGKTEIVINNNKITSNSMVYITPIGSTKNQVPYIKAKVISASESYFTIALDNPLDQDIEINWWIIN